MWKFNLACRTVEERIELALLLVDYGVKVISDLSHRSIAIDVGLRFGRLRCVV